MTADLPVCRLDEECLDDGRVMVGYSRNPRTGRRTSIMLVPAELADGGIPACLDHAHAALDGLVMEARGPATPPDVETIAKTDGEAA